MSLVGDDLRFDLPRFGDQHLIVRFHDIESEDVVGFVAPTMDQVRAVLSRCRGLDATDRLLVHCHAGKSRSPAMVIGILIDNGLRPEDAFEIIKALRPALISNRLMIRQLDFLLGLGGDLVALVTRHYASLPSEALLPDRGGLHL